MKGRQKYLLKNTIVFAIGNIGTKLISFFLVPMYTHILSTAEYGVADLIYTIGTILAPLLMLNVNEAIMRFALDKDADSDRIMNIGIGCLLLATVAGLAIFPCSSFFSETRIYGKYIYLYTVSLAYSQVLLYYLRGKEELLKYSIGNIVHALSIAILNIVFLKFMKKGLEGYFTAYIIANFLTALYAFIVGKVPSTMKNFKINKKLCKNMLKYSVVLIPNSFMWWIMNSSDRLMLTAMIDSSANGIFSISYKIPTLLTTLTSIFNQAWCYSAIREDESADKDAYYNETISKLIVFVMSAAAGILVIIKPFMKVYVAADYQIAWRYTPYLVIGFVFMTVGTFFSSTYTVNKDSKGFLYSGTCGALINIVLNWILIKRIGIAGAALATAIGYITVFVYRIFDTRKYVKFQVVSKCNVLALIMLLVMSATLFIESIIGQILLIVEFTAILFIYRKQIAELLSVFIKKKAVKN